MSLRIMTSSLNRKKLRLAMWSYAEQVKGQGVASAYREQVNLLRAQLDGFELRENPPSVSKRTELCDIYHVHSINTSIFMKMRLLKRFAPEKPLVVSVHFLPETLKESITLPPLARFVFERYVLCFYRQADHLVTVNPDFIDRLKALGFDEKRLHYIPNYVKKEDFYLESPYMQASGVEQVADSTSTNPTPADPTAADLAVGLEAERRRKSFYKEKAQEEFGLDLTKFTVLCVGQIQTRKGVLDFLELARAMPEISFVWAGGFSFGRISHGYKKLKAALEQVPDNVSFLGIVQRENMPLLYAAADLLWQPSYSELFPMTILEAFAAELPVLLRDLSLYDHIVKDFACFAHDNKGFIDKIKEFSSQPLELERYRKRACAGASFYSAEQVSKKWEQFYRSLI